MHEASSAEYIDYNDVQICIQTHFHKHGPPTKDPDAFATAGQVLAHMIDAYPHKKLQPWGTPLNIQQKTGGKGNGRGRGKSKGRKGGKGGRWGKAWDYTEGWEY